MACKKNLAYTGRVQLVKSILISTMTYLAQMFIPPKDVLNRVNTLFRTFIWKAQNDLKGGNSCCMGNYMLATE